MDNELTREEQLRIAALDSAARVFEGVGRPGVSSSVTDMATFFHRYLSGRSY